MQFVKNSIFLYVLHFGNYLYPFFLTPILAKTLGVSEFGDFSYLLSIAQIAVLVVDYGFNYAGIAQVAQTRHSKQMLSETFVTILAAKIFILAALLLVFVAVLLQFGSRAVTLLWFLPFILGSAMTPQWYFVGLERTSTLAFHTVLPKLFGVPVMILVLRQSASVEMAAVLMGAPVAISAISLNYVIWRSRVIAWSMPRFDQIKSRMRESWYIFISQVSTVLYTTLNPILLYVLFDAKSVGYFVVADKLRMACQSLVSPMLQSANARCSRVAIDDVRAANRFAARTVASLACLGLIAAITLCLLSTFIVKVMFGASFLPAAALLSRLCWVIPIVAVGSSTGLLLVMPNKGGAFFARTVIVAGGLNVALLYLLSPLLQMYAAVWSIALVESVISIAFIFFVKRNIKL